MSSKLARQMAYKKRLEEEYNRFQDRCKVRMMSIQLECSVHYQFYQYERKFSYEGRSRNDDDWKYHEGGEMRRINFFRQNRNDSLDKFV